jgi:hypothetical protein
MLTDEEIKALQEDKRRLARELKGAFLHLRPKRSDGTADAQDPTV